jgi:16S rRNA (uracil1498-N3)-methyltransferase
VTLIQAIPKKDKMDHIVEKSTELGVARVIPVAAERTIVSWDGDKKRSHVERWRKIAKEASKQCGRADIPEIGEVTDMAGAVKVCAGSGLKLMAALARGALPIKEVVKGFSGNDIVIAIGPEGDFTRDEIDLSVSGGFKLVDLGPRVLKSDTAGLAVLAALNYEFTE